MSQKHGRASQLTQERVRWLVNGIKQALSDQKQPVTATVIHQKLLALAQKHGEAIIAQSAFSYILQLMTYYGELEIVPMGKMQLFKLKKRR